MLIITHFPRLLEHVRPDRVHVLEAGRIVRTGDHQLAAELEANGYGPRVEVPA
jgi:Fe-S cluster assembly ATP-binding protein